MDQNYLVNHARSSPSEDKRIKKVMGAQDPEISLIQATFMRINNKENLCSVDVIDFLYRSSLSSLF